MMELLKILLKLLIAEYDDVAIEGDDVAEDIGTVDVGDDEDVTIEDDVVDTVDDEDVVGDEDVAIEEGEDDVVVVFCIDVVDCWR